MLKFSQPKTTWEKEVDALRQAFRQFRRANGMTQPEAAKRLNLSSNTISNWERGSGLTVANLQRVSALVDELRRGFQSQQAREEQPAFGLRGLFPNSECPSCHELVYIAGRN